ncbi:MAG: LptF/LptG family permease [Planctomycetota bacterium]|jgi:lipopolysaccharide export system permease protein
MTIIDRYLLRQFTASFVICYLSLTGLYVVFDAFTNLDDFLRAAENRGGLMSLMASYYTCRGILLFDRTVGLLTLVAAMFTVTSLQRHNEMTALMSAGIPRGRVVAPVFGAAIVVTLLAAANREIVIPRFRDEIARRPRDLVDGSREKLAPQWDNRTDILLGGDAVYRSRQRIENADFLLPTPLSDYGRLLAAKSAVFQPPQGERPGGYLLDKVEKPKDLDKKESLSLVGKPVIITPRDAPDWLLPGQCFVVADVRPDQLVAGDGLAQYASTAELIARLHDRSAEFEANARVTIHSRFVQPFLDVTLLLLGVPLVMRRESRNVFIAIAAAAVLVGVFMLVVMGFQYLGSIYSLRPALAAWAPLMIFVPLAVGMSESIWT